MLRSPVGAGMRTVIGLLLIAQSFGYWWLLATGGRLTTSYTLQAEVLPLWCYGLALGACGVGLLVTRLHRRRWWERSIAVVAFAFVALIGWTWYLAGALTAVGTYIVYGWALFTEAAFIRSTEIVP